MTLQLATTTVLAALGGTLFLSVAGIILRRRAPISPATAAYAIGWGALGAVLWSDAGRFVTGFIDPPSGAMYITLVWAKIVLTGTALAGFGTYILYCWTGSRWSAWIAVGAGLAHTTFWMVTTNATLPGTIVVGDWATRMDFQETGWFPGGPVVGAAMFFVPLFALALAYIGFWRQVRTRGQRFRLAAVAVALLLFLVAAAVQGNPDVDPDTPVLALNMLVMLIGGIVARVAFAPPRAWRAYGIEPYAA